MNRKLIKKHCLLFCMLIACNGQLDPSGERNFGLGPSQPTQGPTVIYEPLAKPLPEVPLPNDIATRIDPNSPTHRRLNISLVASTEYERRTRREFNRLDGFGTYAPITVSFDAPLDLHRLEERHQDSDFRNDAVFLLNVSDHCERFGEEVFLDIGGHRFPATHYGRSRMVYDELAPNGYRFTGGNPLFDFDPQGASKNILFAQENEDTNGDGVLSPSEDLDGDGHLDIANLKSPNICDPTHPTQCALQCENDSCFQTCLIEHDQCIADNLLTYYERETDTLILRPIWPLEQHCTYAVILTNRLVGMEGSPVKSPFAGTNHRSQTQPLKAVPNLLSRYGLTDKDVQFAWTFTTGSMTGDIEAIRAGLYGHGPFKSLAEQYPPKWKLWGASSDDSSENTEPKMLRDGPCSASSMSVLWNLGIGEFEPNLCAIEADASTFGGLFGGTFESPSLLFDRENYATKAYPSDHDEVWRIDPLNKTIEHQPAEISFWCALPKAAEGCVAGNPEKKTFCPPFPTAIFAHGYGGSRLGMREHMGRHTAMGTAVCAINGPGHGDNVIQQSPLFGAAFTISSSYFDSYGLPQFADFLLKGRDRDLNNDGLSDSGGDMWTADLFHTRDMVRQSVVDHMQFVRILRHLDVSTGDVNADGELDLGGADTNLGMWGISLGGVVAGVLAGAEPSLDAVSPNAGGAGLVDIAVRSKQDGVPDAVLLPMIGPLVVGCLPTDAHQRPITDGDIVEANCLGGPDVDAPFDTLQIGFIANDVASAKVIPVGSIDSVAVGDRIEVTNLVNGETRNAFVNARGFFRIGIPADAVDAIDRRAMFNKADDDHTPMLIEDPTDLGDALEIKVYQGDSDTLKSVLNTFGKALDFQGSRYSMGSPLVALQEGYGHRRNNPALRRLLGLAQHGISQADPAIWGAHTFVEPLNTDYDPFGRRGGDTHVLLMPTAGDVQVPINTGVAMARVTGLFGSWLRDEQNYGPEYGWRAILAPDARFGKTIDAYLAEHHVIEGDARLHRYSANPVNPNALFDVDNWSNGSALFSCGDSDWSGGNGESLCPDDVRGSGPSCDGFEACPNASQLCVMGQCEYVHSVPSPTVPLRQNHRRRDNTYDAFRMPLIRPAGQHGIYNAQPFRFFDHDAYAANFTIRFLATAGARVDEPTGCDCSASSVPTYQKDGRPDAPSSLGQTSCTALDIKVCSERCLEAWDIRMPEISNCKP